MKYLKMRTGVQNAKVSLSTTKFPRVLPNPERAYSESEREKFKLLRWDSVGRHGRSGRYKRLYFYGKNNKGSRRLAYRSIVGMRNFHSRFGLLISNADPSKWMAKTSLPGCGAHNSLSHMHRSHEDMHFQWFFLKNQGGINPYAICLMGYNAAKINLREIKHFVKSQNKFSHSFSYSASQFTNTSRENYQFPAFSSSTSKVDSSIINIKPNCPKTKNPDSKQEREKKPNHSIVFWPVPKNKNSTPEYDPAAKSAMSTNTIPMSFSFTCARNAAHKISITSQETRIRDLRISSYGFMQKPRSPTKVQDSKLDCRSASSKSAKSKTNKTHDTRHTTLATGNLTMGTGHPTPDNNIGYIPSVRRKIILQKIASEAAVPE